MKERDEELVNYNNMIPYEEFLNQLKEKYPNNCLLPENDCLYRDQLENSEIVYLKVSETEGMYKNYSTVEDELSIENTETEIEIEEIPADISNKGYPVLYKTEKGFTEPYNEKTIYVSEKDKYVITKEDCVEFNLSDYTYERNDADKIITLKKCRAVHNIYIPNKINISDIEYSIEIENDDQTTEFYTKNEYHKTPNKFLSIANYFFESPESIKNLVIENGVKIRCTFTSDYPNNDTDASFLCNHLYNLVYAKLPQEITRANFTFAFCVSLKAVEMQVLPEECDFMFFNCEFLEDVSYIEIPDDGNKRISVLGNCNSIQSSDKFFKFKEFYNKPLILSEIMTDYQDYDSTLESFELPDIENITDYSNFLCNMPYLTKISGIISKYAKNLENFLYNTPNVSGFLKVDCIWFDEMFFNKNNAFNTGDSLEFKDPLVLIGNDENRYLIAKYIETLPKNCNVYVQDIIDSYDYEIIGDTVKLNKYNGYIKRLYVPDTFNIGGVEYKTIVYSGTMDADNIAILDDGCFMNNQTITHIAVGDNIKFVNDSLQGLFYNCTNLIHGIDMVYGNNYECMYAKCINLKGCLYIDNSVENFSIKEIFNSVNTEYLYFYFTLENENINFGNYNVIGIDDYFEPIIKNDKEYYVLTENTSFNYSVWFPKYMWYNKKKYYICFPNPTVEHIEKYVIVNGFFQSLNKNNSNVTISFSPEGSEESYNIIEFEEDNMDYMFYGCNHLENIINPFSQRITSAKYAFFNSGKLFTRFNFGVQDVRFSCAVDKNLSRDLSGFIGKQYPLPNSITDMRYFATNHDISGGEKISLSYNVEKADYAYLFSITETYDLNNYFYFVYENSKNTTNISKIPLIRLETANLLFGKIESLEAPFMHIFSTKIIHPNENEYILPSCIPEMKIDTENELEIFKYYTIYRTHVFYENASLEINDYDDSVTKINEMKFIIDFNDYINENYDDTSHYFTVVIYGKSLEKDIFEVDGNNVYQENFSCRYSSDPNDLIHEITYKPGEDVKYGSEIVVVVYEVGYKLFQTELLQRPKPWFWLSYNDKSETTTNGLNVYYRRNNNITFKFKGNITTTPVSPMNYLTEEEIESNKYISPNINSSSISCGAHEYMNYRRVKCNNTEVKEYTYRVKKVYIEGKYYAVMILPGLRCTYKMDYVSVGFDRSIVNLGSQMENDVMIAIGRVDFENNVIINYTDIGQLSALPSDNKYYYDSTYNFYASNLSESHLIAGPFSHSFEIDDVELELYMDFSYYQNFSDGDYEDKQEYYLKTVFTISPNDWKYIESDNRYIATKEIKGISEIPQIEVSYSSNIEEEIAYIDNLTTYDNRVSIYTIDENVPTTDLVVDLKLLLDDEYATIAPVPPTFRDGTGLINGEWICPYRKPYTLCACHVYNLYKAYWYHNYYKTLVSGIYSGIKILEIVPKDKLGVFDEILTSTAYKSVSNDSYVLTIPITEDDEQYKVYKINNITVTSGAIIWENNRLEIFTGYMNGNSLQNSNEFSDTKEFEESIESVPNLNYVFEFDPENMTRSELLCIGYFSERMAQVLVEYQKGYKCTTIPSIDNMDIRNSRVDIKPVLKDDEINEITVDVSYSLNPTDNNIVEESHELYNIKLEIDLQEWIMSNGYYFDYNDFEVKTFNTVGTSINVSRSKITLNSNSITCLLDYTNDQNEDGKKIEYLNPESISIKISKKEG